MADGPEISSWIGQDFMPAPFVDATMPAQRIRSLSRAFLPFIAPLV